jgi:hypothetical protein
MFRGDHRHALDALVDRTSLKDVGAETTPIVQTAKATATDLLTANPARLRHTAGVVGRALEAALTVDRADRSLLLAAAWLHDIGYAVDLQQTGFHPLDGARHLEQAGWPTRVCGLVAFHSGARFIASELGLLDELLHFFHEKGPVEDALTYADQTTSATGEPITFDERVQEMLRRHGPDSPNARVHAQREPDLRAAVQRVQNRLADLDSHPGRHRQH